MSQNKDDKPRTGNGRDNGQKPPRLQRVVKTKSGTHLGKQTAELQGQKPKRKTQSSDGAGTGTASSASKGTTESHPWFGYIFKKRK